MKFKISLCALPLASLAVHADSRVHTVQSAQTIQFSDDSQDTPGRVAIDGNLQSSSRTTAVVGWPISINAARTGSGQHARPCSRSDHDAGAE
jgi:hypothetical protein